MNLLETSQNFFETAGGTAFLIAAIVVVLVLLIELNYKFFAKYALDFIFALIGTVICSPVMLACAVIAKSRAVDGESIVESTPYLGYKGKVVYLHSFRGIKRCKNVLRIVDVLSGKMSFVGIKLMNVQDGALISDDDMQRFGTRPGLVKHFVNKGYAEMTYEDMFEMDIAYCKKRELFSDIYKIIYAFINFARGNGKTYLGETAEKSYAQVLLDCNEITETDFNRANELAQSALEKYDRIKEFQSDKQKRR